MGISVFLLVLGILKLGVQSFSLGFAGGLPFVPYFFFLLLTALQVEWSGYSQISLEPDCFAGFGPRKLISLFSS